MVCLDSTFLVDVIRGKISIDYLNENFQQEEVFIPSPCILELFRGLYLNKNKKNIGENEETETAEILSSFSILGLNKNEAILTSKIEAGLINRGQVIDLEDIMIAAIAIKNEETLVTKNKKHFERINDLKIESY